MNVVLSAKDADFILKFLRADLEKVSECGDNLIDKRNKYKEKMGELQLADNCPEMILVNGLIDIADDLIDESEDTKKDLMKCIELLTIGSEVVNGVA